MSQSQFQSLFDDDSDDDDGNDENKMVVDDNAAACNSTFDRNNNETDEGQTVMDLKTEVDVINRDPINTSMDLFAEVDYKTLDVKLEESDDMTIVSGSHNEVDDENFIEKVEDPSQAFYDLDTSLNTAFVERIDPDDDNQNYTCGNVLGFLNNNDGGKPNLEEENLNQFDPVNFKTECPNEKVASGIVANSVSSILMMSESYQRKNAYDIFKAKNHVEFGVRVEKTLKETQQANMKRILKNKMKSRVYMREHVEYSKTVIDMYDHNLTLK